MAPHVGATVSARTQAARRCAPTIQPLTEATVGGGGGKPFRQQQNLVHRFALREFLDGPPFVEEAGCRTNDIFTDSFEQEMDGLGHAGVFRAYGHHKRAWFLDDAPRPPVGVRLAMVHRCLRIEMPAHRLDVLLPDIVMQHKITEERMPLEDQTIQVFSLTLVPVGRVDEFHDAGEGPLGQRCAHEHLHPAGLASVVKAMAQLPLVGALFDNQARKAKIPFKEKPAAELGQRPEGASHLARRTGGLEPALGLARPTPFNLLC